MNEGGFEVIMFFMALIVTVLGIILFFKVWGMTNNVKRIRKRIECSDVSGLLTGNRDDVNRMLSNMFLREILPWVNDMGITDEKKEERVRALAEKFDRKAKLLGSDIDFTADPAAILKKAKSIGWYV